MRKWSKLKKDLEERLADSLKDRVQYHITHYGSGDSYTNSRGWITLDGQEVINASTTKFLTKYYRVAHEVRVINNTLDYRDAIQRAGYYDAYEQAERVAHQDGHFSMADFILACETYVSLSIDEARSSQNMLIRAFSMFDRRLGKRQLAKVERADFEHQLVRKFYQIRCEAEGLRPLI